ncbi:bzip transcription factor [Sporothrix schenckii 1099-18]|uniref:Bzip transcription factor n=1 Tax=Sporothrix schenckii 1099-18 TaxID=1397361 RepID=A0A0F2MG13_SPOSC|nr:bzip transcription factor [Sporothrix schenckii 1099-18]KJR88562.1 bzip transcription factor [Sporothrix schenckii 1099-18]
MAPSPHNPPLAVQSPPSTAFSPAPVASAYSGSSGSIGGSGSNGSTPISPASPMSSHDSPKPSTATSTSSSSSTSVAPKPQLAIKPMAPTPAAAVRPLQMQIAANAPTGNAIPTASAASPAPQSPAPVQSPAAIAGKPPMSITSKQWVIPPRPKPGRKPATDTPPTKRKAQNRAAQRAFRERRAARVGELEDLLEDQKNEHDRAELESQNKIRTLESEIQVLRSRCQILENLLEKEKAINQAWANKERQASHSSARSNSMHRANSIQPQKTQHHPEQLQQQQQQQQQHQQSLNHIHSPAPQKPLHHDQQRGSTSSSISSVSGRHVSAQPFSISQIISPPDDEQLTCGNCNVNGSCACADEVMAATVSMDCGKCTLGTKCACLEESINALTGGGFSNISSELKRSHSSSSPTPMAPEEKRVRHFSDVDTNAETDFTHMVPRSKATGAGGPVRTPLPSMQPRHLPQPQLHQQQPQQQQQNPQAAPRFEIPLKERCGFCSDGTYCVCADSMPGVTMTGSLAISAGTVVAQQKTPPPSENDLPPIAMPLEVTPTGAIKLSSMAAFRRQQQQQQLQQKQQESKLVPPTAAALSSDTTRSKCGPAGPGTCAQCLSDPVSGLFCRSLAANFERQGASAGAGDGCCGGGGSGSGCCKDKKGAPAAPGGASSSTSTSTVVGPSGNVLAADAVKTSISLSCADAYKTLSSHRHFDEATDEISMWLPKLRAAPRHDPNAPAQRHPMEVEAASIMSVLKGFDVRFGKEP